MRSVTIYHNPKCTKSRETLALLREHGVDPVVVDYVKEPLEKTRLLELAAMLGGVRSILRTGEAYWKSGLESDSSDEEILEAIVNNPILLERPIVVCGQKAAIGRPPHHVLDIL